MPCLVALDGALSAMRRMESQHGTMQICMRELPRQSETGTARRLFRRAKMHCRGVRIACNCMHVLCIGNVVTPELVSEDEDCMVLRTGYLGGGLYKSKSR